MKCKCLILALLLTISALFLGCETRVFKVSNIYFDTLIELTAYGKEVPKEAIELCEKYDGLLSVTKENGDIYKLNQLGEYPVADETLEIIKAALEYGKESEGLFDISVRPLSALWNFTAESPSVPTKAALENALKSVDYRKIKIEDNRVTLPSGGGIDLGGIAKGYIADKIAEIYKTKAVSGIINLGGNILVVGEKPNGQPFEIGIKKPFSENKTACLLELEEGSAVTCGIYERYFEVNGEVYHHILNPKTGYPESSGLHSVTVICENSTDADALSTTLFLMGEEKAKEYLKTRPNTHAVFIKEDGSISLSDGLSIKNNTVKIN